MLAEHGSEMDRPNADGFTLLFAAVVISLPNVVEVLLEMGVNPSFPKPCTSYTPLHIAVEKCGKTVVRLLISARAD
jgi:ankyrin repeat protein